MTIRYTVAVYETLQIYILRANVNHTLPVHVMVHDSVLSVIGNRSSQTIEKNVGKAARVSLLVNLRENLIKSIS